MAAVHMVLYGLEVFSVFCRPDSRTLKTLMTLKTQRTGGASSDDGIAFAAAAHQRLKVPAGSRLPITDCGFLITDHR